jgi:DNA-binding NtrC family response regulator
VKPAIIAVHANSPEKDRISSKTATGIFPDDGDFSPRRVLVVDDEPLIRWSVSETLADLGCVVEQAGTANAALRAVTLCRHFHVVLLDLRLPDMHDLSLLRALRGLLPAATLILMTAQGTADIIEDADALGASVLHKPFELDALRRLVRGTEAN